MDHFGLILVAGVCGGILGGLAVWIFSAFRYRSIDATPSEPEAPVERPRRRFSSQRRTSEAHMSQMRESWNDDS